MRLRAVDAGSSPRTWDVSDTTVHIGRVDCAIRLADRTVSRRHARLSYTEGRFILEDLNSTGGTFVNERQISGPTQVRDGDRLGFGDVVLLAEVCKPAAAVVASVARAAPGSTMLYTEPPPVVVPIAPRIESNVSLVDPTVSEVPPSWPTAYTPVEAVPPLAMPTSSGSPRLASLAQSSEQSASSMRRLQRDVDAVLASFDQHGGARALQAMLQQMRSGPVSALNERLPAIVRFLEVELALVSLLRTEEPGGRG